MFLPLDTSPHRRPWLAQVLTTLAGWLAAFVIVTTLLTLFGDELRSLPLALRALVLSGVLVAVMANLVMPVLSTAVARWMGAVPPTRASAPARPPET